MRNDFEISSSDDEVDLDNSHKNSKTNWNSTESHNTTSLKWSLESTFQIFGSLKSGSIIGRGGDWHTYKTTDHWSHASDDESNSGIELDLGFLAVTDVVDKDKD